MKIAVMGMGTMGAPMALNLLRAGHQVVVHNRTRAREEPLVAEGAGCAASPADAARDVECVLTCVSDTPDVERVLLLLVAGRHARQVVQAQDVVRSVGGAVRLGGIAASAGNEGQDESGDHWEVLQGSSSRETSAGSSAWASLNRVTALPPRT